MAHDRDHHHGDANSYYVEQLFTIAVCGALGGVMVLMCVMQKVTFLFGNNQTQHTRVLLGGAGLLAVVVIRAVYVWFAVGQPKLAAHDHAHADCGDGACGHEHHEHHDHQHHEHEHAVKVAASAALTSLPLAAPTLPAVGHTHGHDHHHHHDHDHAHDHGHAHGHDHDHDHDHGWAPWRFMLLLLPVILFFLGLPNDGIQKSYAVTLNDADQKSLDKLSTQKGKGDDIKLLSFLDLERAAMDVNVRDDLEGRLINVRGQYFNPNGDPHRFTLQRYKINCCAADAIPLNAVIMINPADQKKYELNLGDYPRDQWVSVTGRVFFLPRPNGEYLTAVFLYPTKDKPLSKLVEKVDRDPNPYAS